jgi:hypothetical protein
MKKIATLCFILSLWSQPCFSEESRSADAGTGKGVHLSNVKAEISRKFGENQGLPSSRVLSVACSENGEIYAGTAKGLAQLSGSEWTNVEGLPESRVRLLATTGEDLLALAGNAIFKLAEEGVSHLADLPNEATMATSLASGDQVWLGTDQGLYALNDRQFSPVEELNDQLGEQREIRQVAVGRDGAVAVAAEAGLYLRNASGEWRALYPHEGQRSWAPRDVRGVAFDGEGRLWFASPQGVGRLDGSWQLFTGEEGLPFNDFTSVAAAKEGVVWFGTSLGAIRFDGSHWEYREGLRWLPHDEVSAIAVTPSGDGVFATPQGVGLIEKRPMSLAEKARFFENEIDKRHRRTPYGYVLTVRLRRPGDPGEWKQLDTDNDGLWTSMYGAGECFAYAATGDPFFKIRAKAAFEALRFLSQVTQGGEHPAPPGFPARAIVPTSGPDPNEDLYTVERDEWHRSLRDPFWKVIHPRWPKSADGQWYWKCDTSSDELDGHFFFYAAYYDLVAATEEEKQRVRDVVQAIADHLIEHNYQLIDWDGKPTRWGSYSPNLLNQDPVWWGERGLNSLSILSYLKVAEHVTGDEKYQKAYEELIREHGYAANVLVPKISVAPGSGNQSDDEMAFMSYYNLLKYEDDDDWSILFAQSLRRYWLMERPELNPFFDYVAAASLAGRSAPGRFGPMDLGPGHDVLEESADTLVRFTLDRIDWGSRNSHRLDVVPLRGLAGLGREEDRGCRRNGYVIPIDERFVDKWNHDPWRLDFEGVGRRLSDGASFLLPYYMGLYHGFIAED